MIEIFTFFCRFSVDFAVWQRLMWFQQIKLAKSILFLGWSLVRNGNALSTCPHFVYLHFAASVISVIAKWSNNSECIERTMESIHQLTLMQINVCTSVFQPYDFLWQYRPWKWIRGKVGIFIVKHLCIAFYIKHWFFTNASILKAILRIKSMQNVDFYYLIILKRFILHILFQKNSQVSNFWFSGK